ncbi:MAG: type II toxin-antitoxin system VapC family toxin [Opitutaceae bacterium]
MLVVDAGPLAAAINAGEPHHAWALEVMQSPGVRLVTFEAAIAEAQHALENRPAALAALERLCDRIEVAALGKDRLASVFALARRFAPRMDFADACAIVIASQLRAAAVLTTDFRDFSIYRSPFVSPQGAFLE